MDKLICKILYHDWTQEGIVYYGTVEEWARCKTCHITDDEAMPELAQGFSAQVHCWYQRIRDIKWRFWIKELDPEEIPF